MSGMSTSLFLPSLSVFISMYVCLSVYLSFVWISQKIFVLSIYIAMSVCLFHILCHPLSISLSVWVFLFVFPSIYLSLGWISQKVFILSIVSSCGNCNPCSQAVSSYPTYRQHPLYSLCHNKVSVCVIS